MKRYIVMVVLMSGFYGWTLTGDFQFDDFWNIQKMDELGRDGVGLNNARIAQNRLLGWIKGKYGDDNPVPYHAVSLVFHIGCCLVLLGVCDALGILGWASFPAVFLWGVHPIICGVVCYIIQSSVIMASFFCGLCFLFYLRRWWGLALIAWLAACYCKQIAWVFPLIPFGWEWSERRGNPFFIGAVIVGEIVGCVWLWDNPYQRQMWHYNQWERLCTEGKVLFYYWYQLLLPHPGNLTLNHDVIPIGHPIYLLLFCAIMILIFWRGSRMAAFAAFAYCALHLVESSVVDLELMFEHRLYLPTMMCVPTLAWCFNRNSGDFAR